MLPQDHPLRRAAWIWPGPRHLCRNTQAQFRHDFDLATIPAKAPLHITADQRYQLFVNGRYVGRGPARGYQHSWPFDTYDLNPWLERGHNWISVRVYNGGISTFQYLHAQSAGLLVAADWGRVKLATGPAWLQRLAPGHLSQTAKLSLQQDFQESFDARLDDESWISASTEPNGAGWAKSDWGQTCGFLPWHNLEERALPNLSAELLPYSRQLGRAAGPVSPGWAVEPNLYKPLHAEHHAGLTWRSEPAISHPEGQPLRLTLPATGGGKMAAVVLDLGQPCIGTLLVEAEGGAAGDCLDFFFCEGVRADGVTPVIPKDLWMGCDAAFATRLRLRESRTQHETFHPIGHRILVAVARETAKPVHLRLHCRHTVYPFALTGEFRCDDTLLNDIHRISVRTQQVCATDAYTDTSWREQAQWWGDARVQAWNTFHLCNDTRLLERGIRCIAGQEVPNGLTFGHAPTIAYNCVLPDFTLIWCLTFWDLYWQSGSVELFREQAARLERALNYFDTEGLGENGLLRYDPRYWLFLDWTGIQREGTPTLLNLWFVLALQKLQVLAKLAKLAPLEKRIKARLSQHYVALEKLLWDKKAGLYRDGIDPEGKPIARHSLHCQTLAINAGLHPERHAAMIQERLLPYLRGEAIDSALPSSYWVTYIYEVLGRLGHGSAVLTHLRRHWAPMVPTGGCWENFASPMECPETYNIGGETVSHAWAAHPIYHLPRLLGGIDQTAPAWQSVRFAPVFDVDGVNEARAVVPTPQGPIRSSWQRKAGGKIQVGLVLPPGIQAEVILPGRAAETITGRGTWTVVGGAA